MRNEQILVINPGSTSTKVALCVGETLRVEETLRHSSFAISQFPNIWDQYNFRKKAVSGFLAANGVTPKELDAIVGRGGLLAPLTGGTYLVTDEMVRELQIGARGQHASNLGAPLARDLANDGGIPAFIVDPVVVDEMEPLARMTGVKGIERQSIFHALNQKAVARRAAEELNKTYQTINLVVAHLGGGISVGAHRSGRVVDVNNALDGDGPFSPERSGGLPVGEIIDRCFSGNETKQDIYGKVLGGGGLVSYLGTNDAREVEERIKNGDEQAKLIYEAMAYQIAKEIGSAATVLMGKVDAVVITGGLAHSKMLTGWIKGRIEFLGPVLVYPGEGEMPALAAGALRVLRGEEEAKTYQG